MFNTDLKFEKTDFKLKKLEKGTYEGCMFVECSFSNTDISDYQFIDCTFKTCDLSNAKIINTAFSSIKFTDCKMLGLPFENCNKFNFSVEFEKCNLNHASFFQLKMKKLNFNQLSLQETDFTECDLSGAIFNKCDLLRATFDNTNLEKADFRTSYNYSFDPEKNRLKGARFTIEGVCGLLDKYDIVIERN